jgi:hypothetical protein
MKFIIYENILISFISYANQICDTGIIIFREILYYLFIGLINLYYNSIIMNMFADTSEAVGRYFGLKRSFRMHPQTRRILRKLQIAN